MQVRGTGQSPPVKLFRTPDRVVVAAAMPGVLPEDITVEVTGETRLVLHGERRGQLKEGGFNVWATDPDDPHGTSSGPAADDPSREEREVLLDEWEAGGQHRELDLPAAVDGSLATATYGNGVLVVALPVAAGTTPARLTLETVGPGVGQRVGSTGHPARSLSTDEHQAVQARLQAEHGGAPGPRSG